MLRTNTQEDSVTLHNVEAEQAILGALLLNNAALEQVSDYLRPEHFADQIHGRIYDAIQRLVERGQIADPITLKDFFDKDKTLEPVGGAQYLVDLANSFTSSNVGDYGRLIYDLFLRRQLVQICRETIQDAHQFDLEVSATHHIENTEKKLYDLATKGSVNPIISPEEAATLTKNDIEESIELRKSGKIAGILTGFADLDRWLEGGLCSGRLYILAARPGKGKTTLSTNIAMNLKKQKHRVLFFSQEMSAIEICKKSTAAELGIPYSRIMEGEITPSELEKIPDKFFYIDESPSLNINTLCNRARRAKRQHDIKLIVIDYLQLSKGTKDYKSNRTLEITEISRELKVLAKDLRIPVLALSQLNRGVESKDSPEPQLSDLRDSGSIEQDADTVMMLFEVENKPAASEHYIKIAKNRHGKTGNMRIRFDKDISKFDNFD